MGKNLVLLGVLCPTTTTLRKTQRESISTQGSKIKSRHLLLLLHLVLLPLVWLVDLHRLCQETLVAPRLDCRLKSLAWQERESRLLRFLHLLLLLRPKRQGGQLLRRPRHGRKWSHLQAQCTLLGSVWCSNRLHHLPGRLRGNQHHHHQCHHLQGHHQARHLLSIRWQCRLHLATLISCQGLRSFTKYLPLHLQQLLPQQHLQ